MVTAELLCSFLKLASENRLYRQSHLSLYMAILMYHDKSLGQNPFRVSRRELMKYSAICSYATYHKCMRELVANGLIEYEPTYHPKHASLVTLLNFVF